MGMQFSREATDTPSAALCLLIVLVVQRGTEKEMIGIYAGPIVTSMTNK